MIIETAFSVHSKMLNFGRGWIKKIKAMIYNYVIRLLEDINIYNKHVLPLKKNF